MLGQESGRCSPRGGPLTVRGICGPWSVTGNGVLLPRARSSLARSTLGRSRLPKSWRSTAFFRQPRLRTGASRNRGDKPSKWICKRGASVRISVPQDILGCCTSTQLLRISQTLRDRAGFQKSVCGRLPSRRIAPSPIAQRSPSDRRTGTPAQRHSRSTTQIIASTSRRRLTCRTESDLCG